MICCMSPRQPNPFTLWPPVQLPNVSTSLPQFKFMPFHPLYGDCEIFLTFLTVFTQASFLPNLLISTSFRASLFLTSSFFDLKCPCSHNHTQWILIHLATDLTSHFISALIININNGLYAISYGFSLPLG